MASGGAGWFPDPSFCGDVEGGGAFHHCTSPFCLDDLLHLSPPQQQALIYSAQFSRI